ncbi:hypothetical protein [Bacillus tropicus]
MCKIKIVGILLKIVGPALGLALIEIAEEKMKISGGITFNRYQVAFRGFN